MKRPVISEDRGIWLKLGPLRSTLWHYTTNYPLFVFPWGKTQSLWNCWTCSKRYDGLRFPPMYRIVTDGIAEGLTLYDVVTTSVLCGAIEGRRSVSQAIVTFWTCWKISERLRLKCKKTQWWVINRAVWDGGSQGTQFKANATILCDDPSFHIVSDLISRTTKIV